MVYKRIKIDITEAQARKALAGKPVRLTANQIGKGHAVSLHPANAKIVERAALKGSGCNIHLSHGELADTCQQMDGSGFWGDLWGGIKKVWKVLKDTGAASKLVDMGSTALSGFAPEFAPAISAGRNLLRSTTGVGIRRTKAQRQELLRGKGLYLS